MAQPLSNQLISKKKHGKRLRRSYNLLAAALIAVGAFLFADGLLQAWSGHAFSTARSTADAPVWLPHMPSKSELVESGATGAMDSRFQPYKPAQAIRPVFQPAVGIDESVLLRKTQAPRQTHVAALPSPRHSKARSINTVSRAIDSGVWNIKGFPEALIRVQQYAN